MGLAELPHGLVSPVVRGELLVFGVPQGNELVGHHDRLASEPARDLVRLGGVVHAAHAVLEIDVGQLVAEDVLEIACRVRPDQATLVPERRTEVTTEGGLDLYAAPAKVAQAVQRLQQAGILVSLFLDPDPKQIEAAARLKPDAVELHTGKYATASPGAAQAAELERLRHAAKQVVEHGLILHAGHGLTYRNVQPVARIDRMCELNIGHSIVSRALMVGMQQAVREMKNLIA